MPFRSHPRCNLIPSCQFLLGLPTLFPTYIVIARSEDTMVKLSENFLQGRIQWWLPALNVKSNCSALNAPPTLELVAPPSQHKITVTEYDLVELSGQVEEKVSKR